MRGFVGAASVALALVLVGCGADERPVSVAGADRVEVISAAPIIPVMTAQDLVSYADHVMAVTFAAEGELPLSLLFNLFDLGGRPS